MAKKIKNITVVGGGNIGTQFACQSAANGYSVTVYSKKPEKFCEELTIVDSNGIESCKGRLALVTNDLKKALNDADLVFITYPAFLFSEISKQIEAYVKKGLFIGILPGTGGAEFFFKRCIEKGAVLFGIQRVPCVARIVEYGKKVCAEGKRDKLYLATIPGTYSEDLASFMSSLFDMPCDTLPNYLCVTMTPSNPILHTTRLRSMFSDYTKGKTYERNPLFYGEWNNESSRLLLACDDEHQKMLKLLDEFNLSSVKSLRVHYESDSPEKLTEKMRGIKSLHDLSSPMKETGEGWIPDFDSRYFTADFPYGLAIIEEISDIVGAEISNIKETMKWYREVTGNTDRFDLKTFGINNSNEFISFYK